MLLELQHVSKSFATAKGAVRAVDDVSLSVDAGEMVAVQGPSGCGKTTLLLMAGSLLAPDSGTVTLAGENPYLLPSDKRADFRARNMGFVFQQFHLVSYLSVLENVLAAAIATRMPNAADRARGLLADFGLEPRLHHLPGQLSTGERQRTALARALLNAPKLLLADEPTGNLDQANARGVLKHLKAFTAQGAVLLVTHDEHSLAYASRAVKIREGRLLDA